MKKFLLVVGTLFVVGISAFGLRNEKPRTLVASATTSSSNPSGSTTNNNQTPPATTFKDGTYTGSVTNAYYGNVQVQVNISSAKITAVQFLQYPNDNPTSSGINQQAIPYLQQETLQAQSGQVNVITGATFTSQAFIQSLQSALQQA
ncbi:MAG TPA: FMN-binding protein [Candidatus Dormibacteraeota bacterium]|nr:FMN-binding protein [Candidatus Dormibacteraeota bacterium]